MSSITPTSLRVVEVLGCHRSTGPPRAARLSARPRAAARAGSGRIANRQAQAGSIVPRNDSGRRVRQGRALRPDRGLVRGAASAPREEAGRDDADGLGVGGAEGRAVEPDRRPAARRTWRRTRPGSRRRPARAWPRPRSARPRSRDSGWPSATISRGFARRLRTLTASGLEKTSSASPSHQNHVGTRCGRPSGRTVDSHTTGSAVSIGRTRSRVRACEASYPAGPGARGRGPVGRRGGEDAAEELHARRMRGAVFRITRRGSSHGMDIRRCLARTPEIADGSHRGLTRSRVRSTHTA